MGKIRVAIAGVGNAASALVQGLKFYSSLEQNNPYSGLMHLTIGPYHVSDIEIVAAFDISREKVGKDISEAIFAPPNNTLKFASPPNLGVPVLRGPTLDGLGVFSAPVIKESEEKPVNVAEELKNVNAEVLVSLVPSGAIKATEFYAQAALDAGCAFINGTPAPITNEERWSNLFKERGLPLAGDDIQSQIGSTILHKEIMRLLVHRKVKIDETYVLDVGGGAESLNAVERDRNILKRKIKSRSIASLIPYEVPIVSGSSDFVDFLLNQRTSYFWIAGKYFGGAPIKIDIMITTWDGPNGAGILVDVIRGTKVAMDRTLAGPLISVSAYGFKNPPVRVDSYTAEEWFHEFIEGKRPI